MTEQARTTTDPPDAIPDWERRFRAPTVWFPSWARDAPDRLVVPSNQSGAWQLYAWDRASGLRRQVTDDPIGVVVGDVSPDGRSVVWFRDTTGDEVGHWIIESFDEDRTPGDNRRPFLPDVPDAWSSGLALGDGVTAVGTSEPDGFTVWVSEGDEPARPILRGGDTIEVGGLSRDSALLSLHHAEHGDNIRLALRVVDARRGATVGEQWDGAGLGLTAGPWSPVAGDQRLAIMHEREGWERPAIWDLATGERQDLQTGLPGDVVAADWWFDASALLLLQEHQGRNQLFRFDLVAEELTAIDHPAGTIGAAGVRPDGDVWFRHTSGASPASVRSKAEGVIYESEGDQAPAGQPYRAWSFTDDEGRPLHGFVAMPPTPGPHPVVMLVHGGPAMAFTDTFSPETQAWVDHGFAVAMVNYRGSTGYGTPFRDILIGDPGLPEVADVVAGLDRLVADGVADPAQAVLIGGSWGGYVTLLALGLHPDRWAASVAAVPVADYLTAYEDESPPLQAFDRTLFGGSPDEAGDLYRERSPLTYVDRVSAPVLIVAGDNDSRCPIRQVLGYVDALHDRGGDVELYRFDAGHGTLVMDERVRQMAAELAFVLPRVPSAHT